VIYKIAESSGTTEFRSEEDVVHYVLKKLKINPKIIGSETGLTFVDKEIGSISRDLEETEVEPRTDLIAQLGIEQTLSELSSKLDSFKARANSEKAKCKERNKANIEEMKNDFDSLKADLEVQEAELEKLEEEHTKNEIKEDDYRTYRVKRLKAIAIIKTKLINLQKTLKEKCTTDINSLIETKTNGAK
jgi:chromosome segregation ATPase